MNLYNYRRVAFFRPYSSWLLSATIDTAASPSFWKCPSPLASMTLDFPGSFFPLWLLFLLFIPSTIFTLDRCFPIFCFTLWHLQKMIIMVQLMEFPDEAAEVWRWLESGLRTSISWFTCNPVEYASVLLHTSWEFCYQYLESCVIHLHTVGDRG